MYSDATGRIVAVQPVLDSVSAIGTVLPAAVSSTLPRATQAVDVVHETLVSIKSEYPDATGRIVAVQPVLDSVSTTGTLSLVLVLVKVPTATQAVDAVHETLRILGFVYPDGMGRTVEVHVSPDNVSAIGTPVLVLVTSASPTATQVEDERHEMPKRKEFL
jgi:hypothetical protein